MAKALQNDSNSGEIPVIDAENTDEPLSYNSVYAYYKTLPDYMQQQENVIDAARTIERFGVYLDNFQRQVALNYVAGLNIPKDEGRLS